MFVYCLNNPVLLLDSDGLRAVINNRDDCLGKQKSTYSSDGQGKSDELLEYCKPNNIPNEYDNFQMSVQSLGNQFKATDHSMEYADWFLSLPVSALARKVHKALGVALSVNSGVSTFMGINDVEAFPDGYYDTYKVTVSWTENYHWDGGATYTYASYEFIVCWDTISNPTPNWQIYTARNNSYSIVVQN